MPPGDETKPESSSDIHEDVTVGPGLGSDSGKLNAPDSAGGVASLHEFSDALLELGLIDQAELDSFAADSAEGVLGLSRALVKAGKLTPYQAAAVYQRKSRGLLVGNYVILDKLGQGGMGVVFKCRHRRLGRIGALKILPPSFARDRQAVMRFRREVEAAGRLKHPNVVAALDADEDRGVHFLVMDYVEGRDLDRIVRDCGPLPVGQAIDCLIQAARGLEAAHAQGIVHRDIKPGNLMVDNVAGAVRVLDLGLARIVEASNPFNKTAAGRLTESGMYMGTIDFMAPEQAEDAHRVDGRADIYSLGCTLFYLLTGREPFPGETVLKRLLAHMERPAPGLRLARPDVPAALDETYERMMAKRPEDRPESMTKLVSLLEAAKDALAQAPAPARGAAAAAPKSKPGLKVFDKARRKGASPPRTKADPSIFARPDEAEGLAIDADLNLEDLVMDVRSEPRPEPLPRQARPMAAAGPLKRSGRPAPVRRMQRNGGLFAAAGAVVLVIACVTWFVMRRGEHGANGPIAAGLTDKNQGKEKAGGEPEPPSAFEDEFHTIFDGTSPAGWMLCNKQPLPRSHVQKDGLNPNGTGSELVVYQDKLTDFVLDFDYKLEKGCNSGVCLRVSDLTNPVNTGIEVQLKNTTGHGLEDSGAFFGLVAPETNAQKPAGQTNHMTITAQGPDITVVLNGRKVSTIHLDEWTSPGKRPDGSSHKFTNVAIASLARTGYVGFQGRNGNCWFKDIRLKKLSAGGVSGPGPIVKKGETKSPVTPFTPAAERR